MKIKQSKKYLLAFVCMLGLSACSNDMSDLKSAIDGIKASTPADIEPIPEIRVYEKYTYQSALLRSPFVPDETVNAESESSAQNGLRPNPNRNKEFLEQFPLDTLTMVGTLERDKVNYALVITADGLIHQIRPGNYLGQNEGEIMGVSDKGIEIRELVPDGLGGYIYRANELPLEEVAEES